MQDDSQVGFNESKSLVGGSTDIISDITHLCLSPLFLQVSGSSIDDSAPDQRQMAIVLSEAFQAMRAELDCLPLGAPSMLGVEGGLGGVGEAKTAALLEEYSLLLLQAVSRRLDTQH